MFLLFSFRGRRDSVMWCPWIEMVACCFLFPAEVRARFLKVGFHVLSSHCFPFRCPHLVIRCPSYIIWQSWCLNFGTLGDHWTIQVLVLTNFVWTSVLDFIMIAWRVPWTKIDIFSRDFNRLVSLLMDAQGSKTKPLVWYGCKKLEFWWFEGTCTFLGSKIEAPHMAPNR